MGKLEPFTLYGIPREVEEAENYIVEYFIKRGLHLLDLRGL